MEYGNKGLVMDIEESGKKKLKNYITLGVGLLSPPDSPTSICQKGGIWLKTIYLMHNIDCVQFKGRQFECEKNPN